MVIDAQAGLDPRLCHASGARVKISSTLAVDACFSGPALTLSNSTMLALEASRNGDVGDPTRHETDIGLGADATRLFSHDPGIFLPGDKLIYPIGSGAGTVSIGNSNKDSFYALASTLAAVFPGKPAAVLNAFTSLVAELDGDYAEYQRCIVHKNWLEQVGCDALRDRNVAFAIGRALVGGAAKDLTAAALTDTTYIKWAHARVVDAQALKKGKETVYIAAAQRTPPATSPPPTTPSTTTAPAPPTTTTPSTTTSTGGQPLAIGSSFASECVVAWPTAPVVTSNSIQMTMSCDAVPENEYLFTDVVYGDPNLHVTPNNSRAYVVGKIVDVATSGYGYKELVVQASSVKLQ
jgi:hypothetical protein